MKRQGKEDNSLSFVKFLLVFFMSGLVITGISFIDSKMWNIIFAVVAAIAGEIVANLANVFFLSKHDKGQLTLGITIILLALVYKIYEAFYNLKLWLVSLSIWIKLIPVFVFVLGLIVVVAILIRKKQKSKKPVEVDKNGIQ